MGTEKNPRKFEDNAEVVVGLTRSDQEAVMACKLAPFFRYVPIKAHEKKAAMFLVTKTFGNAHMPTIIGCEELENKHMKNMIMAKAIQAGHTKESFNKVVKAAGVYHHPIAWSKFGLQVLAGGHPKLAKTVIKLSTSRKTTKPSSVYLKMEKAIAEARGELTKGIREKAGVFSTTFHNFPQLSTTFFRTFVPFAKK